jgi:transglutaminase-like putative cysteine protease
MKENIHIELFDSTATVLPVEEPVIQEPTQEPVAFVTEIPTEIPTEAPTEAPVSEPVDMMRTYDITEMIELTNDGPGVVTRAVVTVAMIQTIDPYQVVEMSDMSESFFTPVWDDYGNMYADVEIGEIGVGETYSLEFTYRVTVNRIQLTPQICGVTYLNEYLYPEEFIESDHPGFLERMAFFINDSMNPCEKSRAIYDYMTEGFTYTEYDWEDIGALGALRAGQGDYTEYSDLFIAFNRAAGIPANFMSGVTCCTEDGSFENVLHNWTEVYLPGNGWAPVDPTLGRFPEDRDKYFAAMPPDHIIITRGRNPEPLWGYQFYTYEYWWGDQDTDLNSLDTWSIVPVQK